MIYHNDYEIEGSSIVDTLAFIIVVNKYGISIIKAYYNVGLR